MRTFAILIIASAIMFIGFTITFLICEFTIQQSKKIINSLKNKF